MSEPKFKRGQTVSILPRNTEGVRRGDDDWENSNVGGLGVVTKVIKEIDHVFDNYESGHLYELWLIFEDETTNRLCYCFEERYLELYCSNEIRGLKILEQRDNDDF